MGGGEISTSGQLTFKNSKPDRLLFRANGDNVVLVYPKGVESVITGSLNLSGNWENKTVTGDIDLSRLRYTRRFDPEEVILGGAGLKSAGVTRRSVFFDNMELNIAVRADDNIHMENNFAQAELAADFRLVGTFRKPVLLGRVEVLNGFLFYRDRTFNIISASLDNFDRAAFNPVFDFRARTKVKSYNIYVSVNGTKEKMYPVISSEPSLPTIDVINLLALGKPRGSIYERSEETLMGIGLSSILSQSLVGGIEKGAAEIFGFDRFRIDPFLLGGKTDPTARLTVGKRITRDLNIIYSTNIGRTQEDVLILEYRLGDRTLFVASRDEYGAYGVEIQFESKF
jgi:translocation and assembly module TamB